MGLSVGRRVGGEEVCVGVDLSGVVGVSRGRGGRNCLRRSISSRGRNSTRVLVVRLQPNRCHSRVGKRACSSIRQPTIVAVNRGIGIRLGSRFLGGP